MNDPETTASSPPRPSRVHQELPGFGDGLSRNRRSAGQLASFRRRLAEWEDARRFVRVPLAAGCACALVLRHATGVCLPGSLVL